MDNISVLTNFMGDSHENIYYHQLELPNATADYTIHQGGNFIFISNKRNRTIRFSLAGMENRAISTSDINDWLKRIHALYPGF